MENVKPIVNRVAQNTSLATIDLEEYYPKQEEIVAIDLKAFLFKELILREADFRETVKNTNWSQYTGQYVVLFCSANAIIPMWAYMILSAELTPYAKDIACSPPEHAADIFLYRNIAKLNADDFKDKRVIVKGCGDRQIPEAAFVQIAQQLTKVVRALMYGEACSSVPVFKKVVS
ncbi:MAG TPA: DUF2480 family protein [Chitinophagales bacterium]|nr:DUF2480 family protein [Chitinophagales bacterium]